ncbi:Ubiquinone/menaquinone biosynthesis C-methylase UbiE [Loktanella sp. DSM 29012]|nr:class I SAM-dependent methyltransferase [Loktanella sp. DSM 29012]SEQ60650.1 Ubiquinone/menaquinone biosynthesis C-methylase UbiE [Loktanella sp. DSM 29012]
MSAHSVENNNIFSKGEGRRAAQTDWQAYATAYDLLSAHNPEYQSLLSGFEGFLSQLNGPSVIYDIGGGTGNYSQIIARRCPNSQIRFIEPDSGMLGVAQRKLSDHDNIIFENAGLESAGAPGDADLIVSIHSLYAMPDQEDRLADMRRMLRPGGLLYLVDLGREMNVSDWRRYLFGHLRREHGLLGACRIFWQGREIAKQNANIRSSQEDGTYWTHSGDELATAVRDAGFEILRQEVVYRGYSDLLVCRAIDL